MKFNIIKTLSLFLMIFSFSQSYGQVQNIKLEQKPGVFVTESLVLAPGDYQFEIANNGIDHEVGFVVAPKGKYDALNHIKSAYVKTPVPNGKSSLTSVVSLKAGEYEYFCPLNPTDKYPLTVSAPQNIKLTQVPGKFKTESLVVKEGTYQFEIANEGVDHEVGFVVVPKGKYEGANHIKAAYVKAPVSNGKSSLTSVVSLPAGEYEYFCPLNPTGKYPLTVSNDVKSIKLTQVPGKFKTESIVIAEGIYQFEIANEGVDHELGFVVVPKGKYDPSNHIKAAYVKAPVSNGKSSLTSVVSLSAGEYEYFCPLNPTDKYPLTVRNDVNSIKLTQVPGKFNTESLAVKEGTYQFEIANEGVDHEVGFVVVPKGKYDPSNHIKAAYVNAPVANGKSSLTNVVSLKAGEYEYFCPLNPTDKYPLTVRDDVKSIKLTQVPGKFNTESVVVAEGTYQFEIANEGVDHEVGFVVVPKGKYDPSNHIKAAYVNAPVSNGKSSLTNFVSLKAGEYEYFCPLNPTDKYPLTVRNDVKSIKLTQVPGKFNTESLTLKAGLYQFEIANEGVDHELGFVVVPKGKYDPSNHIKAAYVNAPVANGKSSLTNVVSLKAGEYEYFCPLNPTAKNSLTVK